MPNQQAFPFPMPWPGLDDALSWTDASSMGMQSWLEWQRSLWQPWWDLQAQWLQPWLTAWPALGAWPAGPVRGAEQLG